MIKAQIMTNGVSIQDRRGYMKIKPKFPHGQKMIFFCGAVKQERVESYKRTHRGFMHFINKHETRKKIEMFLDPNLEEDIWINRIANNKKRRLTAVDDNTSPPLDTPKCVIAQVPGYAGYDKMMDEIFEEDSVF